jgi:hypothetical protein
MFGPVEHPLPATFDTLKKNIDFFEGIWCPASSLAVIAPLQFFLFRPKFLRCMKSPTPAAGYGHSG